MLSLLKYRDLFWQLTTREIRARYKQSILGYGWAIFIPLINLLVLSIVFSHLFRVPTGDIPYPIFLLVALVPWTFMVSSITLATSSIVSSSSLVTKIKLPREILPITAVTARVIDLVITSMVLILFLVAYQVGFHLTLLYVPFIFLIQLLLIIGIAFFLSATNVFFRDIENAVSVALSMWMYLTPIVYSPQLIPENLRLYFNLNPMTGIINAYRVTILYGTAPEWGWFFYSITFSVVIFISGLVYFKQRAKYFADII